MGYAFLIMTAKHERKRMRKLLRQLDPAEEERKARLARERAYAWAIAPEGTPYSSINPSTTLTEEQA